MIKFKMKRSQSQKTEKDSQRLFVSYPWQKFIILKWFSGVIDGNGNFFN